MSPKLDHADSATPGPSIQQSPTVSSGHDSGWSPYPSPTIPRRRQGVGKSYQVSTHSTSCVAQPVGSFHTRNYSSDSGIVIEPAVAMTKSRLLGDESEDSHNSEGPATHAPFKAKARDLRLTRKFWRNEPTDRAGRTQDRSTTLPSKHDSSKMEARRQVHRVASENTNPSFREDVKVGQNKDEHGSREISG